jgi:hypothetical protein
MLVVELVLLKSVGFSRYEKFGVFGLNGHLGRIRVFFWGFGDDLPSHFQVF